MLSEMEWKTISNILLELYTVEDLRGLSERTLNLIRMLIPYTAGYLVLLDEDQHIIREKSYFTGFSQRAQEAYVDKYFAQDYLHYLFGFTKETTVFQDTKILSEEIRKRTDFYTRFLKPVGLIYGAGVLFIRGERITGIFNLFRDEEMGDFGGRDTEILEVLRKHLENMIWHVTQSSRAEVSVRRDLANFAHAHQLTAREADVLGLINRGYSNQEIADALVISLSTVKKHIYNIFSKTGAGSRSQLISLFLGTCQ